MHSRPQYGVRSPILAYVACFVAGGATIGTASYAFHLSTGGATAKLAGRFQLTRPPGVLADAERRERHRAVMKSKTGAAATVEPSVISRVDTSKIDVAALEQADSAQTVVDDSADRDAGLTPEPWLPGRPDTYRTVCVRLCDGAFTPVSFSTTRDHLKTDAARCQAGCAVPTRLFYSKAGTVEADDLIDLNGALYSDLPNAHKFRTSYDASCSCHGQPWDEASYARHRELAAQSVAADQDLSRNQTQIAQSLESGAGSAVPVAQSVPTTGYRSSATSTTVVRGKEVVVDVAALATGSVRQMIASTARVPADLPVVQNSAPKVLEEARPVVLPTPREVALVERPLKLGPVRDTAKPVSVLGTRPSKIGGIAKTVAAKGPAPVAPKKHVVATANRLARPSNVVVAQQVARPSSRDWIAGVRGNARAQREFRSTDYWRLSFWEPRN